MGQPAFRIYLPAWGIAGFVWLLYVGLAAALIGYVQTYSTDVPYLDDWDIVPALTGQQPITPAWLLSEHNEHRVPIPRLLLLGLCKLTDCDFRAGVYFNAAALIFLSFLLLKAAARVRGRTSLVDALIPIVLLSWGNCDSLLWGWQIGFVTSTLLAGIILATIVTVPDGVPGGYSAVLVVACVAALPLTGANGLAFTPALILWLLAAASKASKSASGGKRTLYTLRFGAGLAGAFTVLYLAGYRRAHVPAAAESQAVLRTALEFLSLSFGPLGVIGSVPLRAYWYVFGWTVLGLFIVSAVLACRKAFVTPRERVRASGLCFMLAGALALAISIGLGRAGFAADQAGLMRRYVTLTIPGTMTVFFSFLLYAPTWMYRLATGFLLAVMLLLFRSNTIEGLNYGRSVADRLGPFLADLDAGLPPMILADRYTRYSPRPIRPREEEEKLENDLVMLQRAGLGRFRKMRPNPQWRPIMLNASNMSEPEQWHYLLKKPWFVYAIRLHYRYIPPGPYLSLATFSFRSGQFEIETQLLEDGKDDHLTLWLDQTVAEFQILPGDVPTRFRVWDLELWVPP
jgi:hypothetical protein